MLRRHFMINTDSGIPDIADIPNNEIWYTSSDGNIVTLGSSDDFPTILSNIYNGKGVIKFETDLTTIESYAFSSCDSLTSITIPNSVTSIKTYAFAYCDFLISVIIPDNVTSIGQYAYRDCSSLNSVTIGNSVKTIQRSVFYNCKNLISITYTGTSSQWNAITKQNNWNYNVPATVVHCTDGDVEI